MEYGKDITIKFINKKENKILLNSLDNNLPTIHIKEDFYSEENIKYYLSMYLNINIEKLKNIKDEYYYFEIEDELKDYEYKDIESLEDLNLKNILSLLE